MAIVLVIDDEKVIREGCRRLLSAEGHTVLMAENGEEGLRILATEKLDLILCDLRMPVMGAAEVLERVASEYKHIPIVIITGQGTIRNAVECMKKGAYDFITKPFRTEQLTTVVRHALEKLPPPSRFKSLSEVGL